jgi:hypothetical protein
VLNRSMMRGLSLWTGGVLLLLPVVALATPPETAKATEADVVGPEILTQKFQGFKVYRGDEPAARPLSRADSVPWTAPPGTEMDSDGLDEVTDPSSDPAEKTSGNSEAAFWVAAGALAVAGGASARKQSTKRGQQR